MTIKQYQKVAANIAKTIESLGGDPNQVRSLKFASKFEVGARNPKLYKENPVTMTSGDENVVIVFDTISNPNNPNCKFRTLKPGSISLFNSETRQNVDASDFNFDSAQFADLMDAISTVGWEIVAKNN